MHNNVAAVLMQPIDSTLKQLNGQNNIGLHMHYVRTPKSSLFVLLVTMHDNALHFSASKRL